MTPRSAAAAPYTSCRAPTGGGYENGRWYGSGNIRNRSVGGASGGLSSEMPGASRGGRCFHPMRYSEKYVLMRWPRRTRQVSPSRTYSFA